MNIIPAQLPGPNSDGYEKWKLEDVGTRYSHLQDLLSLWDTGLTLLKERQGRVTTPRAQQDYLVRIVQLTAAIELLKGQIDLMAEYRDKTWDLRKEIDSIKTDSSIWKRR